MKIFHALLLEDNDNKGLTGKVIRELTSLGEEEFSGGIAVLIDAKDIMFKEDFEQKRYYLDENVRSSWMSLYE